MMKDRANIFHQVTTTQVLVPNVDAKVNYSYLSVADIQNQVCQFIANPQVNVTESQQNREQVDTQIIDFPIGTDVRKNDRVENLDTGEVFVISFVSNRRSHHLRAVSKNVRSYL